MSAKSSESFRWFRLSMVEAAHWQWVATKQGGNTQLSLIFCYWWSCFFFIFVIFLFASINGHAATKQGWKTQLSLFLLLVVLLAPSGALIAIPTYY